jgi:O-antigen ligase
MKTIVAPENDYNVTEEGGRINVWKRGITYMMDHPITGVGAENFAVAEGTISPMAMRQEFGKGVKWGAAHNSFVQVGAELGVGGLIVFIAILTSTLLALRKADLSARDSDPPDKDLRLIAQSMGAGFFGFTTGAFFLSFAYREPLYTLIALAIGAAKVTMARQDPAVMYESDPGLVADTMSGDPMVGA